VGKQPALLSFGRRADCQNNGFRSTHSQPSPMTTPITQADLIDSIAAALQYISYYHPADFIAHLARAYEREQSPAAKDAMAQILTNSKMAALGHRPICQDTGIVNVFLKVGMDVRWSGFTGSLDDAINEGVRRGYNHPDNMLRASVVADPQFARKNTRVISADLDRIGQMQPNYKARFVQIDMAAALAARAASRQRLNRLRAALAN